MGELQREYFCSRKFRYPLTILERTLYTFDWIMSNLDKSEETEVFDDFSRTFQFQDLDFSENEAKCLGIRTPAQQPV